MSNGLLAIAMLALCVGSHGILRFRQQRKLDVQWEERHPRSDFKYCGRTLLFYEGSHGNQVEYLDSDGYCYLWYPGNSCILVGRWRSDGAFIYFQYGTNTYNPVLGVRGGQWEPCPISFWSISIVEDVPGDALNIKKRMPFVLRDHPPIRSIGELRAFGRD